MTEIRNICVYCGSGSGTDPIYASAARILGTAMAHSDIGLVYGGGNVGLMGETARTVLAAGGYVTGIIPEFLMDKERALEGVQDLIVTKNMHERKMLMFERADAFVALPGGIGTLEELVEMTTWRQLGRHTKPIIAANIGGFWQPFMELLEHMRGQDFIRPGLEVHIDVVNRAEDIVPTIIQRAAAF